MDGQQCVELTPDFPGESRHEFVAKLAYQNWEGRGRPIGSPDIDWFAAEQALYQSLVASGLVSPSASNRQDMEQRSTTSNLPNEGVGKWGTDSRMP
jgi:hypothetical protein